MSEKRIYVDPIKDPKGFLKAPFGKSIREAIRDNLANAGDNIAAVTLLCDKYPWLLAQEDREFLEEAFWRLQTMRVRNKNG